MKQIQGAMDFESLYTAGIGYEKFLKALKEEGKILASMDPKTKKLALPTRLYDEKTLTRQQETKAIFEDGAHTVGTLQSFTTVYQDLDGKPLKDPLTLGLIGFKNVEGHLVHFIHFKNKTPKIGSAVKPKFLPKEKRTGSILDIQYFEAL